MNAIEIKGLTKRYKDFTLDNVSLTLPCGCIMGLVGENGAGKSTTIKLMLDMLRKNDGEIILLGKEHTAVSKEDIGVVLEENGFPESLNATEMNHIFKNVYKQWDEEKYFEYLERFELPPKKKIKDFSKGMKMKLYISAALSHNARLLILDEPTSGLDPVVRDEMLDIFNDFTRDENNSILISSHIVSDLEKLCDYIAFIHKGKLILCEEKDTLLNDYCLIQCDESTFGRMDKSAVLGYRKSEYGINAVVKTASVKGDVNISPLGIEDLFVYMIRGKAE